LAIIRLEGLSLFGHHGANAIERSVGTRLGVDLELELDTAQAEHTDRLRWTVNYDKIFALVRERVEGDSFHLLEALAGDIAHACLTEFGAARVKVRVSKQNLGWPSGGRAIIEVERRQGDSRPAGREGSPRPRRARGRPLPRARKPGGGREPGGASRSRPAVARAAGKPGKSGKRARSAKRSSRKGRGA
jgi:dihydroneopterin aldolase